MTTTVKVDAHAGWPVEVTLVDQYGDNEPVETVERVEPNTERDFYVTDTRQLRVRELTRED